MTVASTNNYTPTIDRIVQRAMIRTGLKSPSDDFSAVHNQDDVRNCREHLQETLTTLIGEGVRMRFTQFRNLQLVVDQYEYDLGSDVLDVIGDMKYIEPGQDVTKAEGEIFVKVMPIQHWDMLNAKDATASQPTQCAVYRQGTPLKLRFWPIPAEAGVVRYSAHVQPSDSVYGEYDVDLESYWHEYLTTAVAFKYALDNGLDQKAALLASSLTRLRDVAMAKSSEGTAQYFYVETPSPWRRR
jgi:hypothetical protein